jgi:Amidase
MGADFAMKLNAVGRFTLVTFAFTAVVSAFLWARHSYIRSSESPSSQPVIMKPKFDVLRADVKVLHDLLSSGSLNSVDFVKAYSTQIQNHDKYLKAMLSMPPMEQLFSNAEKLDHERSSGKTRGPLHGILVILKVLPNPASDSLFKFIRCMAAG